MCYTLYVPSAASAHSGTSYDEPEDRSAPVVSVVLSTSGSAAMEPEDEIEDEIEDEAAA